MVRYWRWDLADAIPAETEFMTCFCSILSSLWDDRHGEELRALHGVVFFCACSGWDKSDYMYNILTVPVGWNNIGICFCSLACVGCT